MALLFIFVINYYPAHLSSKQNRKFNNKQKFRDRDLKEEQRKLNNKATQNLY